MGGRAVTLSTICLSNTEGRALILFKDLLQNRQNNCDFFPLSVYQKYNGIQYLNSRYDPLSVRFSRVKLRFVMLH